MLARIWDPCQHQLRQLPRVWNARDDRRALVALATRM